MKHFSALVVILLFSFASFSQKKWPGYIVMNNGDTVRGTLKRTSAFNNKPGFILYDNKKKQKILETEALAFGWVNDTLQVDYEKIKVRKSLEPFSFLRRISKGKYSVFEDRTIMGNFTIVEYFFKSADGKIIVLNFSDKFDKKNTLKEIFADCPTLVEQIKGIITRQKVLNWIDEYNNCTTITTK